MGKDLAYNKMFLQIFISEEPLGYKELKRDGGLMNYVFATYRSCRPFLKEMHLTLDSWCPHQDPEGRKQGPYGLGSDLS